MNKSVKRQKDSDSVIEWFEKAVALSVWSVIAIRSFLFVIGIDL